MLSSVCSRASLVNIDSSLLGDGGGGGDSGGSGGADGGDDGSGTK